MWGNDENSTPLVKNGIRRRGCPACFFCSRRKVRRFNRRNGARWITRGRRVFSVVVSGAEEYAVNTKSHRSRQVIGP